MYSSHFFYNKVALVTGASSGIGQNIAFQLAGKGISVILVARREDRLKQIVKEIISHGGKAEYIVSDLTQEKDRILLKSSLQDANKLPDILVNNAGIGWYGYFHDMPWKVAQELITLNIEATAHLTSLFLPSMESKQYGHIINIGSVAGKLPEQGIAMYASSKAFLNAFTTVLFRELAGTNVHVSIIRAGPIKTEFFDAARKMENGGSIPAEKLATPVTSVSNNVWLALKFPRKVVYVPFWMVLSPLLEVFFGWAIDLAGPLLLKARKNKS